MTGLTALTRLPIDSSGLFRQAGIWIHIGLQCIWAIQNDLDIISCQLLACKPCIAHAPMRRPKDAVPSFGTNFSPK